MRLLLSGRVGIQGVLGVVAGTLLMTVPARPAAAADETIFRSPDLIHWSKSQTMGFARQAQFRQPTHRNPMNNEQTHEGASVWNRGNILLGFTGLWHGASDWNEVTHDLGLLISNDGLHFREPPRHPRIVHP